MRTGADTFVVADGTAVPVVDLHTLLAAHRSTRAAITVVAAPERRRNGDGDASLRSTGVYVFDRRVFEYVPEEGFQDIKERLIPDLYRANERVLTFVAAGAYPPVVSFEAYLTLNHLVLERTPPEAHFERGFRVVGDAVIHESASVNPSARLVGPVLLGPEASVGAGATVIGPASIGAGTTVGRGAAVSRSVLWSRCTVGDGAFLDRCLLADRAGVGARQSLFSTLQVQDGVGLEHGPRLEPAAMARWAPLAAALRPPATPLLAWRSRSQGAVATERRSRTTATAPAPW